MLMNGIGKGSSITNTVDNNMQGPESTETLYTKQKPPLGELLDTFSEEKMKYINFLAKQIGLDLKEPKNNNIEVIKDNIDKLTASNVDNNFSPEFIDINLKGKGVVAIAQVLGYENFINVGTRQGFVDFIIWLFKGCYIDINQLNDGDYEIKKQLSTKIENIVGDLKNIFLLTLRDLNNIIVNYKTLYVILRDKKYFDKPINNPRIYEYLQAICKLLDIDINKLYDEFKKQLVGKKKFQAGTKTIKKNKIENFLKYDKPEDYYKNLNKGSAEEEKNKAKDSIKTQIEQKVGDIKYIFLLELKEITAIKLSNYNNQNNIMSFLKDEGYLEKGVYVYKQADYVSAICKLLNIDENKLQKELQKELIEKIKAINRNDTTAQKLWKLRLEVGNKKISLYTAYKLLDPSSDINNKKFNKGKRTIKKYLESAIKKLSQS